MTITKEDYQQAIERFVADMRKMGDDAISVLLYGSAARGDILPGKSDIDSLVYLSQEVFEDRERFLAALAIMLEACERLSKTGIPFHPFHYYSLDELGLLPAVYLSCGATTKVILGDDIRHRLSSSDPSRSLAQQSSFQMRRLCHPLAAFLNKKMLTPKDHETILDGLLTIRKFFIVAAGLALDIWEDPTIVAQEIKRMLPQIDISVLNRIKSLRALPAAEIESDRLREVLREALLLVENLHEEILAIMKNQSKSHLQPSGFVDIAI